MDGLVYGWNEIFRLFQLKKVVIIKGLFYQNGVEFWWCIMCLLEIWNRKSVIVFCVLCGFVYLN